MKLTRPISTDRGSPSPSAAYGVAVVSSVLVTLTKLLLDRYMGDATPFLLLFTAPIISSWYGGFGPGMLATVLTGFTAAYLFLPPKYSLALEWHGWLRVCVFHMEGLFICFLSQTRNNALQAQIRAREEAEWEAKVRAEAENTLRATSTRFQALFENSREAIGIATEGRILYVNPAYADLLGYASPEEMIGLPIEATVAPVSLPEMRQRALRRAAGEDEPNLYEYRGLRKDSTERDLENYVSTYTLDGKLYTIVATRDITERKQEQTERQYILQSARCLLWSSDIVRSDDDLLVWTMRYFDEEAAQRLVPIDAASGDEYIWKWHALRLPEDKERTYRLGEECVRAGQDFQVEFRMRDREERLHWLREDVHIETLEPGRRWRAVGVCTDIHERKEAEAERARLASIIASSNDAIIGKNLHGIVTSWNPAAERLYGYTAEEMIGHSVVRLLPPDHPHELAAIVERLQRGERVDPFETVRLTKAGRLVELSFSVSPIHDTQGALVGAATIAHDITERKQAEREIARRQAEIETLNVQLRRSIRETHHRVKNNLQIISAMLDLQAMQHKDSVPVSEITRLCQHIKALATIHDLMTHQAKEDSEVNVFSVSAALERLMPMLQEMSTGRRIVYSVEDFPFPVRQGTTLIVLINELVSNATKHGKGTISVRFAREEVNAVLEVSDEGTGFSENFDSLQAANTGLELVESLTRYDFAGEVNYENRTEGGARVTIRFPLASADYFKPDTALLQENAPVGTKDIEENSPQD